MWTPEQVKFKMPEVNIKIANYIIAAHTKDGTDGYCCVYNIKPDHPDIGGFAIAVKMEAVVRSLNEGKLILS